ASETDGDGNVTSYTHDAFGNVLTVTDAQGTTTYTYDQAGNLFSATDALNRRIDYVYDGNRLMSEARHNPDGRLADLLLFGYDPDGNLTSASNGAGSYSFTYDGGELETETTPWGVVLTFQHDGDGFLKGLSDSLGAAVTVRTNALGEMTRTTYTD